MKMNLNYLFLGFIFLLGLTACESDSSSGNIMEVAAADNDLSMLVSAMEAGGLSETLQGAGPYTVFAPNNTAFNDLLGGIMEALQQPENRSILNSLLSFHIVPGTFTQADLVKAIEKGDGIHQLPTVNGDTLEVRRLGDYIVLTDVLDYRVTIVKPDMKASNGVVHAVNSVLVPKNVDLEAVLKTGGNIIQVLSQNNQFSTLIKAIRTAELDVTMESKGPYTFFAPNNEAFSKLPEGRLNEWMQPENKEILTNVLKYHVMLGALSSKSLRAAIKGNNDSVILTTLGEEKIEASLEGDDVIITDANGNSIRVISTDLGAYNGVIHIVDGVALPPSS